MMQYELDMGQNNKTTRPAKQLILNTVKMC